MSMPVCVPLEVVAFTAFAKRFLITPNQFPDSVLRHLNDYRSQWGTSEPNSMLGLATSAFAFATLSQTSRVPAALITGALRYHQAVAQTNEALQDTTKATTDELLLTVIMLRDYDVRVYSKYRALKTPFWPRSRCYLQLLL